MVQRRATAQRDEAQLHAAAAFGVATPASRLPFADRIQRAFGRHDISSIRAHVGADAAASAEAMGAAAYATGDHVVLGEAADLFTVAHEAAHVVQQRGGIQLRGGVGQVGDAYERHADEVAELVVQGHSAEQALDAMVGSGGATPAVQRMVGPVPEPSFRSNLAWSLWFQAMTEDEVDHEAKRLGLSREALGAMDQLLSDRGQTGIAIPRSFGLAQPASDNNNNVQRDVPGSSAHNEVAALTFSFEREGFDPNGINSITELNILIMYYPRDRVASEDDWFKEILNTQAFDLIQRCKAEHRDPLLDPGWGAVLNSSATKLRRAIRDLTRTTEQWTQMYRTSIAPAYLRERLLNESGGMTWETTHASKERDFDVLVQQLRDLEQHLGHTILQTAILQTGLQTKLAAPYHLHVAFRRPTFTSPESREEWAKALTTVTMHLNTYATLRMYESGGIDSGMIGPYTEDLLGSLYEALVAIRIPRGENIEQPKGGLETTMGASNVGAFKSGTTAIRHCYKSDESGGAFDPEILGFELRAWTTLEELIAHMRQIEKLLRGVDKLGAETPVHLGGTGPIAKISELMEFSFLSQDAAKKIKAENKHVHQLIVEAAKIRTKSIDRAETTTADDNNNTLENDDKLEEEDDFEAELDALIGSVSDLALRMMMPFLDWHKHPSVPEEARAMLVEERAKMISLFESYYRLATQETESKEQEQLNDDPFKLLELEVQQWAQRTRIWKYF